jgi:hypothetical protein
MDSRLNPRTRVNQKNNRVLVGDIAATSLTLVIFAVDAMGITQTRAIEYLHVSGAAAIWFTERGGVCSIHMDRFVGKSRDTISAY